MKDRNHWYGPTLDQHAPPPLNVQEKGVMERLRENVVGASSLAEMLDLVYESSAELMDCDRVSVAFLEDENHLVTFYSKASYEPLLLDKGFAQDIAGSSLDEVLRSGRTRVIEDLEQYLAEHPQSVSTRLLVSEGVRSSMTCPLRVDERAVGVLFRSSKRPKAFGDKEVALHVTVAGLLSQAVEKSWRIEQLERANRAYTEMLGFVSHELKSPLSSIVMDAEVLSHGYLGALAEPARKKLDSMIHKAEYLLGLIGDYLDLARVEGKDLAAEMQDDVDLWQDIITLAISVVEPQAREKTMNLEARPPSKPVKLRADPQLLKIAAVNLLSNAIKYGDEAGTVRVAVQSSEGRARLSVWNSGPGFPKEQAGKLFRKFSRLDTPALRQRKGSGVGLYTTWRIAGLHGGKVSARSEPGVFAEFALELPTR
jgi:signal transduction histidine kinase